MSVTRRTVGRPPRGPDRTRRDPRAERRRTSAQRADARAQPVEPRADAHSTHASADPRARTRRDPRAERRGAVTVGDRLRIDRARPLHVVKDQRTQDAAGTGIEAGAATVRIPEPACWVLAVPDQHAGRLSSHDRDTLGAARRLADARGGAVVVLAATDDAELGAAGADRVMRLNAAGDGGYAPEARAAAVLAAVRALNPRHIVLPDVPQGGGDLGRRVAAALGEMPATNVVHLDDERVTSRGDGGRRDFARSSARVVLVAPEAADAVTGTVHEAAAMPAPVYARETARVTDLGLLPVEPATVPLAEAGLILSGGAGVDDWAAFHALAGALGATEGGSRVVCDAGALPRDRQVGASGAFVSARGYIALGISGAPQHLDGIKTCECVIAVNTDAHAEIVKRADLAVIGDVQAIMPALLRQLGAETRDDA